jgi:Tripartite ATP-independent periplasmic transporter, DctM component
MEVGLCHPPVGLNLYVASGIARMGITELTRDLAVAGDHADFPRHGDLHSGIVALAAANAGNVVRTVRPGAERPYIKITPP